MAEVDFKRKRCRRSLNWRGVGAAEGARHGVKFLGGSGKAAQMQVSLLVSAYSVLQALAGSRRASAVPVRATARSSRRVCLATLRLYMYLSSWSLLLLLLVLSSTLCTSTSWTSAKTPYRFLIAPCRYPAGLTCQTESTGYWHCWLGRAFLFFVNRVYLWPL